MLNMALLNIMSKAGSGGFPLTAPYNIFGLMSPAINCNVGGHYPHSVFIWNRFLTTFQAYVRCDDNEIHETQFGVGGCPTIIEGEERLFFNEEKTVTAWGISTKKLSSVSRLRMGWGFIDTAQIAVDYKKELEKGEFNILITGYNNYYDYLPPIGSALTFMAASILPNLIGGTVWQAGLSLMFDGRPAQNNVFYPFSRRTPIIDNDPRPADNWDMAVVPLRGVTAYPKNELSNSMLYGFLQIEYPNQIGMGLSYTFGVAQNADCLPKQSKTKCGGQAQGSINSLPPPQKVIQGIAPFNLDIFLKPFIRAGVLRSYNDAQMAYEKLQKLILNTGGFPAGGAPTYLPNSGAAYNTHENIWQGLIDGWLEQPYKDIFIEIGADSEYYMNALQTFYPTECNFYSILGCGSNYNAGTAMNSSICALIDAISVFKALSTYPEEFPVDLPRLVAAT